MHSDPSLPPDEVKAKIEFIARVSPKGDGPPTLQHQSSPVIPPHNPQGTATNDPLKSTGNTSLISFDDDSDEFVDAHEAHED